jgi:hypothetical protein
MVNLRKNTIFRAVFPFFPVLRYRKRHVDGAMGKLIKEILTGISKKGRCSMKWFDGYRMRLMLVGFVAAVMLSGGRAKADLTFGPATNLGPTVNSSSWDNGATVTSDGLELYFGSNRPGGYGDGDIWVAKRPTKNDDWGEPVNLGPTVNSTSGGGSPSVTGDGLELYFTSARPGGYGSSDIWVTKRETKDSPWGEPMNLGQPANDWMNLWNLCVSSDGLEVYFVSATSVYGGHDMWVTKRATKDAPWSAPVNIAPPINGPDWDSAPAISPDGLVLIFSSSRLGGFSTESNWNLDLWLARRKTKDDPWGEAVNLGPSINTPHSEMSTCISADGRMLYFWDRTWEGLRRGGQGGTDIWQAQIIPIVDFNSDRKVDIADLQIMVDHWGENYSLCDIGPMPWGDGTVNAQDLIVLAEHLPEDYRLIAHWELDETEGSIAYDSAGDHDGTLNGNPFWQPAGGQVDGTLLFDGVDDYMSTPFILDPSKGSFSVFAWVYCWTPGQVIISQTGEFGGTWLGIDPSGKLMTGFSDTYFGALESESVITDMQWHHIGFVYDLDTLHRRLYVDGVQVAEDATVVSGMPSEGGLYIGASKDLDAGTFFSGMIDDVRIYNQALTTEEIAALAQ